jgi:WXXGXW repeat (2 copies)
MRKKSRLLILAGLALATMPVASFAFVTVGVSINIAPPALPVYVQPPCPTVGYIWTPGYWAWADGGYYWVPGTWVGAPGPGLLWTPGYWGWSSGVYLWHGGYWGPHVGFYGGVNYGFGYGGVGFAGGYWHGGAFFYNRSVANLGGLHVTNVYNKTVINNVTVNRVSFNGGTGGIQAHATAGELAAAREHHVQFTPAQREHEHLAANNHDLRASVNGGNPRVAATARPGVFTGHGVVGARAVGGPIHGGGQGAGPGRGPDVRTTHNDRPPGASGARQSFNQPPPHYSQASHIGQPNQARGEGAPPAGHPGGGSHNMPRPQSAPRQEPHRGGGEPHGQARGGRPEGGGHNPQEHGRR